MVEFLRCQRDGNKHKQPKQWVATDFLKEQLHGAMIQFPQTLAIRNTTKVQCADRMDSTKRGNRSMHSDRTLDRTRTVANENDSCPLRLPLVYINSLAYITIFNVQKLDP